MNDEELKQKQDFAIADHFIALLKAMGKQDWPEINRLMSNPPEGVKSGFGPTEENPPQDNLTRKTPLA